MFSFHIKGFAGGCDSYWCDSPIDVTVFAETEREAVEKVEAVVGKRLSGLHRKITAKEAEPVKHGRWIHDINNLYGCSECLERETMSHKKHKNYCPNCGAKMDLEG